MGTLAYLAPESTGRTGRPVEQRADLYALGATLYELATGAPPFGSGDPLRLVHDHLTRVPVPPAEVNPAVPAALTQIILHLLEKEPDHRYQSADGLLFDLERLGQTGTRAAAEVLRVGAHDCPPRLLPPFRLVGRDEEVVALEEAFEEALAGRCRGVLVGGAPGVGKTAVVDQLRPVVTGGGGWFVAGKFDSYRRDLEFDGVAQAFRALGRLLLAEPEDQLTEVRERLLAALGPNAGLATAVLPEFATLLGVPPDAGDPLTAQPRAQRNVVAILRAVASRTRPVVVFVDDLQWAGRSSLGSVDQMLSDEPVEGLLLVAAYRDVDVDATHPLASTLARWRDQAGVRQLRLANLPAPSLAGMVAEMLHVDPAAAGDLAAVIGPQTAGNPYETVELLDALRRAGLLTASAGGWQWEVAAVRAHLGKAEAAALSAARARALPAPSRAAVEAMACLGGRADAGLLQTATGQPAAVMEQALAPALQDGLLLAEPGPQLAVQFRHDRLREAVLAGLDPSRQRDLQLSMARRLAGVPELFAVAAEQYLSVLDFVDEPAERHRAVGLLRRAADQATLTGDHARVNTLLSAALPLIKPTDTATLTAVHIGRHAALYGLGRLEEADVEYLSIEGLGCTAAVRAGATAVQVRSLTYRNLPAEAVALAVRSLRELGIAVPAADRFPTEVDGQFGHLYRWLDETDAAGDLTRPELTDPALLGAAGLLNGAGPAAYYAADHAAFAWFSLEALRMWLEHGLCPALVAVAGHAAYAAVALRDDYAAGCRALRRILAAGEARGYEPATSQARSVFALYCWWFEPLENGVQEAQRAREGLLAGGALASAAYGYRTTASYLLDCAPTLDGFVAEVEAGLAFVRRTGNQHLGQSLDSYRWLAGLLRGETPAAEGAVPDRNGNPLARVDAYLTQAVAAAIFGDQDGLARHTAAAMPLLPDTAGFYPAAMTRLLRGLALAGQARSAGGDGRGALLAELDEQIGWLAARAVDAPDNFLDLVRLLDAERAWAVGDFRAAALAFDFARREAAGRRRPWHRALIADRAARFHLAHGLDQAAYELLALARDQYAVWGATAKVAQLDWAHPTLHPAAETTARRGGDRAATPSHRRATVTTGTIDLLGILAASQALSSQTELEELHARVVEVLGALTGATAVHLLLWDEDRQDWLLPTPTGPVPVTGHDNAVPLSVLRYAQRTGQPLLVADAKADDRFARDSYFADADRCSLLALPVFSRGALGAVLILENRLLRGAFTADRLDAVNLIAGQLAVSLENAQARTELRGFAEEQAALRRVATLVARGMAPEEVFATVTAEVGRLLDADLTHMARSDPDDMVTVVGAWAKSGGPVPNPVGSRMAVGGGNVVTQAIRTGRPMRIDRYEADAGPAPASALPAGMRAAAAVPIVVERQVWGVMILSFTRVEPPPADTEARLAGFTELVATAVANAQARVEVRGFAEEQAALRRVATFVAQGGPPEEVFAAVTAEVGRILGCDFTFMSRYDSTDTATIVGAWTPAGTPVPVPLGQRLPLGERNLHTLVARSHRPARIDSYGPDAGAAPAAALAAGMHSAVGAPIEVEGRLWGLMIAASRGEPLPADTEARLAEFTELVATAVANAEAQAQLGASRARIVATADATRRRIERNLHDGAQQRLVSLALELRTAQAKVPPELGGLVARLDRVANGLGGALDELREIARGLHPTALADGGLSSALKTLGRRSAVPVRLDVRLHRRLPDPVELAAYYTVAEALTNAAKHAQATVVDVQVDSGDGHLRIQVHDDGRGGADLLGGSGLLGLKDRVEALGGRITLDSPPGAGTTLHIELPLHAPDVPGADRRDVRAG
jgi:signal transduction histidine kinase